MKIRNIVYEQLKQLNIPCNYLARPEFKSTDTVLSYHFFNRRGELYGDGERRQMAQNLQVDIFTLGDWTETEDKIIKMLEKKRFRFNYSNDDEEVYRNRPLYHRILVFSFVESEVLR